MSTVGAGIGLWKRALEDLSLIRLLGSAYTNITASRAYYAAFHAVSAHFALEGREFVRHQAVQAAVHRDLVRPGTWSVEMGQWYEQLLDLRRVGDYGSEDQVSPEAAAEALTRAEALVESIRRLHPDVFLQALAEDDAEVP